MTMRTVSPRHMPTKPSRLITCQTVEPRSWFSLLTTVTAAATPRRRRRPLQIPTLYSARSQQCKQQTYAAGDKRDQQLLGISAGGAGLRHHVLVQQLHRALEAGKFYDR